MVSHQYYVRSVQEGILQYIVHIIVSCVSLNVWLALVIIIHETIHFTLYHPELINLHGPMLDQGRSLIGHFITGGAICPS